MSSLDESLKKLTAQFENLKNMDTVPIAMAGAYRLLKGSQEKAPVKTGFLRQSGNVQQVGNGAEMRFDAEYAFYVEFGNGKWTGKPYVRPTIDTEGNEIVAVMAEQVNKQLQERGK